MKNYAWATLLMVACLTTSFSIKDEIASSDKKSLELIKAMEKVNGGWRKLASKRDVQYTYVYVDKAKGVDISVERYIFDSEISWADYSRHEVNVMPGIEGNVKQRLANGKSELTLSGKPISDQQAIEGTEFIRKANFFWFTMMYKQSNPGANHKYLGQETVNGINYDKVSVVYNSEKTGKSVNDEYILYFNPDTHLIDVFYFSLHAWGINGL